MGEENNEVANNQQPNKEVTKQVPTLPSPSERFTAAVEREFAGGVGEIELTNFQKKLCQNYFIKIDGTLKGLETKRLKKDARYREELAFTWDNVNLNMLALDVVAWSAVGLDPLQPNHINCIPFKNSVTNKYDITFIPGYRGIEIKARKYGFDIPDDVVVEVVYANDKFHTIKKDRGNPLETYDFQIVNPFDRGDIVGGFFYIKYFNKPEKNRIRPFSKADIEKRKPDHASPEFWGGQKDKWEKDAQGKNRIVGKEDVEGWLDEMVYKTIYKAAYNSITIDSTKIDGALRLIMQREQELRGDDKLIGKIAEFANKNEMGFKEQEPIIPNADVVDPAKNTSEENSNKTIQQPATAQQNSMEFPESNPPGDKAPF